MTCLRGRPQAKTSNLPKKVPSDLKPPPSKWPCWTPQSTKERSRYAWWGTICRSDFFSRNQPLHSLNKPLKGNSLSRLCCYFPSVGSCVCRTVLHRGDKTDKKNKREGAMLRAHQGFGAKAMLHISVINTAAQKKVHEKKVHTQKEVQDMCCHYSSSVERKFTTAGKESSGHAQQRRKEIGRWRFGSVCD